MPKGFAPEPEEFPHGGTVPGSPAYVKCIIPKETDKTKAVRAFLTQEDAGIDYLNKKLARSLKNDGRVIKLAGLFLHGTPKVNGWTKNPKTGRKELNGICELADLQTVFLYLDNDNEIRRIRRIRWLRGATGDRVGWVYYIRRASGDCSTKTPVKRVEVTVSRQKKISMEEEEPDLAMAEPAVIEVVKVE